MHISDYTKCFSSADELAAFCMLGIDEQNAVIAGFVDAGVLKAERTCRIETARKERASGHCRLP